MATIPSTPARPRSIRYSRPCTVECAGKRCAGIHPGRPLPPGIAPTTRRGLAALMMTTEARVQTR